MRGTRKVFSMAAAGLLIGAGLVLGGGSAGATTADCTGGANGFVDIPDSFNGTAVEGEGLSNSTNPPSTASVLQEYATINGVQRGFGRIQAGGQPGIGFGLWMDVTNDGGRTWIQCGPFGASGVDTKTTPAYPTNNDPNRKFRTCGSVSGPGGNTECLDWW